MSGLLLIMENSSSLVQRIYLAVCLLWLLVLAGWVWSIRMGEGQAERKITGSRTGRSLSGPKGSSDLKDSL